LAIDHLQFSKDYKIRKILIVFADTVSRSVLFLDYTATLHIFSDQNLFISYYDLIDDEYITVGGKHHILVSDIGSVKITVILPHSSSILTFNNVLFIPLLGTNLISLGTL